MPMGHGTVRRGWVAALGAVIGASVLMARSSAAGGAGSELDAQVEQQPASCGVPGQAPCPMQAWMRASIATPLASNDAASLVAALERTARLAPDASWTSWGTFAANGATAARRGDIATTRASCKGCHEAWREKYRAGYRARPLPR
jgi:cytochrome c551/c552